jgi:hypothetical protein
MRMRFQEIRDSRLVAHDGVVGKVDDLLIEDGSWTVRYLAVRIGQSHPKHQMLISTAAINELDIESDMISTILTSEQIVNGPSLDDHQPISRQYEERLVEHFGWPNYWLGRTVHVSPQALAWAAGADVTSDVNEDQSANLRSVAEICGYRIVASDGQAGRMNDLMVNSRTWMIDYATAMPNAWLTTEDSVFSTHHIDRIEWKNRTVFVDFRQQVSPGDRSTDHFRSAFSDHQTPQSIRPAT